MAKTTFLTVVIQLLLFIFMTNGTADDLLSLSDGKISVQAENVPLRELLFYLQEQGVSVQINPQINPLVTASFYDKPIDRGLSSILKSFNYSLGWKKSVNEPASGIKLVELRIFQPGFVHRSLPLVKDYNLKIGQNADNIYYVKNSLLIKPTNGVGEDQLKTILSEIDATIVEPANKLGIVKIRLPDFVDPIEAARILSITDGIAVAEPDYAYRLNDEVHLSNVTELSGLRSQETSSDSTLVAVLDSGLLEQYAFSSFVSGVYDAIEQSDSAVDHDGHGTQMSLIASGVVHPLGVHRASEQLNQIVAVRVFDDNGFTSNYTLMRSIEYAQEAGAKVVSMSWGTEHPNSMLEALIEYASENDLILLAAAGNNPTGTPVYPAAYKKVIGVGALNPDGSIWEQSNFGEFVSVYAPGVAEIGSDSLGRKSIYAGTSIATAYMANLIADTIQEYPDIDANKISVQAKLQ